MNIDNSIIKHYLKNVLFINGTAYAGKSTMTKLISERFGLILCGENYDCMPEGLVTPERCPNLGYFQTMKDWQEFINRTPEEYAAWIRGNSLELVEFEVAYLMRASVSQKVIVDTNIPPDILREIADYNQVAIMLSPMSVSVERFFDRGDADKAFLKARIAEAENPEKTMANFRACMARVNSREVYGEFANSGFFTMVREDPDADTKEEVLAALARHFGLE